MSAAADLRSRARQEWRGARRTRQMAAAPRYLVCALVAVLLLLGLRSLFLGASQPPFRPAAPIQADAPSRDIALQFARAYLTYDARRPGQRNRALAPFLGESLATGAGFGVARGAQRVQWAQIASDQRALVGGRLLTVAAKVSTQRLPLYLAITVRHQRGGPLELLGYPSLVGAPAIAAADLPTREVVSDRALLEVLARVLRNYLSGAAPDLRADLSPAAAVTLPTARLRLRSLDRVEWLGERAVLATLTAADDRGATYTLAYELGIARRERPYVDFIEGVPTAS